MREREREMASVGTRIDPLTHSLSIQKQRSSPEKGVLVRRMAIDSLECVCDCLSLFLQRTSRRPPALLCVCVAGEGSRCE